jgi:hypothetical protein
MEDIFNVIIQDKKFLENVKSSVNNIMMDGKVDISDIPEIILLITTTINTFNNLNINENILPELIKKIFDFIVPNKNPDFDKIVNSAIKLVMFQPIIQKEVKKCCNFFSCFRKKETSNESKPLIEELNSMSSLNENKVEVTERKKNKLKLHNIEITSDDELVNINVINEVNEIDNTNVL